MSENNITPFIIRIQTALEKGGVQGAKDELAALTAEVSKNKDKTKESASESQKFGQNAGRAAEMVGSLTGAMGANSPAAAQMSAGIRTLKTVIDSLNSGAGLKGALGGLATIAIGVAIAAYANYKKKVEEAKKATEDFLAKQTDDKLKSSSKQIDGIAEAFSRVEKAINATRAAQSELAAAWQDLNKAGQEVTDMEIERQEKADLAKVLPGDAAGATAVKNRYAQIREETSLSRRQGDAVRAEQAARDDLEAAAAKRVNIEETLKKLIYKQGVTSEFVDKYGRVDVKNLSEKDRIDVAKNLSNYTEQLNVLNKNIADLKDSLAVAKTNEEAAGLRLQAAQIRGGRGINAASALAAQNAEDLDRSTARARVSQRVDDLRTRAQSAAQAWDVTAKEYRARSDAFDPRREDYRDQGEWNKAKVEDHRLESAAKGAEKQAAAVEKLLSQLEKTPPEELVSMLGLITQQLAAFERGLSNVKKTMARPGSGG